MLANAGLPMLALHLPAMFVLLLPVIAAEYLIGQNKLPLPRRTVFVGVGLANLASTFIGIPLTWFLMTALNFTTTGGKGMGLDTLPAMLATVVLQASWLAPYKKETLDWLIPATTLVLLVPYFFASVFIERYVYGKLWKSEPSSTLTTLSWQANGMTYALLATGTAATLIHALG